MNGHSKKWGWDLSFGFFPLLLNIKIVVFCCFNLHIVCVLFVFHHLSCVQMNSPSMTEPLVLGLPLLACCVTLVWCPVAFRLSITAASPEYSLTGLIQDGNTISSVAVVLLSVDFCRAGFTRTLWYAVLRDRHL